MYDTDFELAFFVIIFLIREEFLWRFLWLCLEIVKQSYSTAIVFLVGKRFSKTVRNIDDVDQMKYESVRYATYVKFPSDSPIGAKDLAKNGFFYYGWKNLVKCFSCSVEHDKWKENENPASVHAQISPNCQFVKGCSPNVPLDVEMISPTDDGISAVKVKNARYSSTVSSATNDEKTVHRNHGNVSAQMVSDKERGASTISTIDAPTSYGSRTNTENCFAQSNDLKTSKRNVNHTDNKPNMTEVNQNVTCRKDEFEGAAEDMLPKAKEKYITIEARLNSFAKWPKRETIDPGQLASAGLYYTGTLLPALLVMFSYVTGKKEDDPYIVHARWFPHCPNLLHKKGSVFIERNQSARPKTVQVNTMNRELFTSSTQEQRQCLVGNGDNGIRRGDDSLYAPNGTSEGSERVLCKFCSNAKRNILFKPCGHVDVCETCAYIVPKCLTCDAEKSDFQKVFIQ